MADVFLSYRNTVERRAYVERLRLVLDAYSITAWWDYGLEAGKEYELQIMAELAAAGLVCPLWCAQSIGSGWVAKEAQFGADHGKLLPAPLQAVTPPAKFERVQGHDLVGWDGSVESFQVVTFASAIAKNLGRPLTPVGDKMRALRALARLAPLDATAPAAGHSSPAWARIEASLDPDDYSDFAEVFKNTQEGIDALRRKRQLETWARVGKDDVAALGAFLQTAPFPALEAAAAEARRVAEEAARARETADALARRTAQAEVRRKAEEAIRKLQDSGALPEMVTIPPGRFLMGLPPNEADRSDSEGPQHEVRIDYSFALGKHPVTFAQWDAALAAGAKLEKPGDQGWGRGDRPVIKVSWNDAQAYIALLNGGADGPYRLPSEAEWEYACRAGTTTPFSFGQTISTAQANYDGNHTYGPGKKGESRQKTTPVGSFPANGFGLYDMHGNVWEWCADAWNDNYNGAPSDASAWLTGDTSQRVLRGGSRVNPPQDLRSAVRYENDPSDRFHDFGFRVARTVLPR